MEDETEAEVLGDFGEQECWDEESVIKSNENVIEWKGGREIRFKHTA